MRKLPLPAYLFIFVLLLPNYAFSSEWLEIENSAGGEKNYVDLGSIVYTGPVATFWTKNIDRKGEMTRTSYHLNCEAGTGAIKEIIIYNSEEAIVKSYFFKEDKLQWGKITPKSFMHVFRNVVCENKNPIIIDHYSGG